MHLEKAYGRLEMIFTQEQLEKYADVLIWGLKSARTGKFKKGDIILVQSDLAAVKLAETLQPKLLDLGVNPVFRIGGTCGMERNFYKKTNNRQLTFVAPGEKELYGSLNGRIYLYAPESLTHLQDIDSKKIGKALIARKPLREIMDKREEKGIYGWTLCAHPTPELARQARLPLKRYTDQVIKACYLDRDDPVKEWDSIYRKVSIIKQWLDSLPVKAFHIESANMDLLVTPGERRRWLGISGHNIPSFELFLSPDWRGTEGTYYADQPSFRSGNYVEKVQLVFKKGSVVKIEAEKGRDFARKQIAMDKGAGKVGELSLTDRRFSRIDRFMANTLFDENYGGRYGNCHIAVGSSYSDTYNGDPSRLTKEMKKKLGFNDSALHWDLVNTEKKTVTAHMKTGEKVVIYEDGIFKW
jgi:aminopeptidase